MFARAAALDIHDIDANPRHALSRLATISLILGLLALGLVVPASSLADDPTFTVQVTNELGVPVSYGVLLADPGMDPADYSEDQPGTAAWSDDDQGDFTWSGPAGSDATIFVAYPGAVDSDCQDGEGVPAFQAIGPLTLRDVQPDATQSETVPTTFPDPGASASLGADEQRFAWLVNQLRATVGAPPVEIDPHLDTAASAQAQFQNGRFSASDRGVTQCGPGATTPDFRALEAGYPSGNGNSGEVSADRTAAIDPDEVFAALESSPADYLAMTDPDSTYVGIAIVDGASDNHLTADFQPADDGCVAPTTCGGLGFGIEGVAHRSPGGAPAPGSSGSIFSGATARWGCAKHAQHCTLNMHVRGRLRIAGATGARRSVHIYRIDQVGKAHVLATVRTGANGSIGFAIAAVPVPAGSAGHRAAVLNARWASVELRYVGNASVSAATVKVALHISA
jgi:uncharacterized protein YkwD